MANDLNQVKIDGRLVEAPKIKQLDSGARVATIRIANNRYFKGKEEPEWKEKTGFFEVQAWNALADSVSEHEQGPARSYRRRTRSRPVDGCGGKTTLQDPHRGEQYRGARGEQGERCRRGAKSV